MVGKKNIVFGFVFLLLSAALGPVMVNMYDDYGAAMAEKQTAVGRLQQLQQDDFEEDLEPLDARQIAIANTAGILSLNTLGNVQLGIDAIKGGPHAHGNLESLLNIVVGLVLGFVAVNIWFKQLISWLFIGGAVLHAGMLYLNRVFELAWAGTLLGTGLGPIMILLGLLLMAVAVAMGFRAEPVRDK